MRHARAEAVIARIAVLVARDDQVELVRVERGDKRVAVPHRREERRADLEQLREQMRSKGKTTTMTRPLSTPSTQRLIASTLKATMTTTPKIVG